MFVDRWIHRIVRGAKAIDALIDRGADALRPTTRRVVHALGFRLLAR
jgi:hypothetical protein